VLEVVEEYKKWHPLTLRQIYYRMVGRLLIENNRGQYQYLSSVLKWMRIDDMLDWDVIHDPTHTTGPKRGWTSIESFISWEMSQFLRGYQKCLVQGQFKYVEVWVEKNAAFNIVEEVAYPYCVRTISGGGYTSITGITDFYQRASDAINRGQRPHILYFGDLDPSGKDQFKHIQTTLIEELEMDYIDFTWVGLTPHHVQEYDLPIAPDAVKLSDPRYYDYVGIYGEVAVELEALPPEELQILVSNALEEVLDVECMDVARSVEAYEKQDIERFRKDVHGELIRMAGEWHDERRRFFYPDE
jgi:hypothetical protein